MPRAIALIIVFVCSSFFSPVYPPSERTEAFPAETVLPELMAERIFGLPANQQIRLPDESVLHLALTGYLKLAEEKEIDIEKPLTIIDFSLPSSQERMWIIDLSNGEIIKTSLVSHGRNSGNLMAKQFSNIPSSFMSSLGFFLTAETYHGKHGYSLRLDGIEQGFNDKARERAIVIHGADYATESVVKSTGRLGRSLGCPALPEADSQAIIDMIKEQSILFIYGEDASYLSQSNLIRTAKS